MVKYEFKTIADGSPTRGHPRSGSSGPPQTAIRDLRIQLTLLHPAPLFRHRIPPGLPRASPGSSSPNSSRFPAATRQRERDRPSGGAQAGAAYVSTRTYLTVKIPGKMGISGKSPDRGLQSKRFRGGTRLREPAGPLEAHIAGAAYVALGTAHRQNPWKRWDPSGEIGSSVGSVGLQWYQQIEGRTDLEARPESDVESMSFRGRHDHTLDNKGRVSIPAGFRMQIQRTRRRQRRASTVADLRARITSSCFPQKIWEAKERDLGTKSSLLPDVQKYQRLLIGGCSRVPDRQPGPHHDSRRFACEHADLHGKVTLAGVLDKIEIWNHERFENDLKLTLGTTRRDPDVGGPEHSSGS